MSSSYQSRDYQRPEEQQSNANIAELVGTGFLAGAGLAGIAGLRIGRNKISRGIDPKQKENIKRLAKLNKKPAANAGVRQKDLNTPSTLEELSTRINKDLDDLNEYAKTNPELASFLDKAYKETDFEDKVPPSIRFNKKGDLLRSTVKRKETIEDLIDDELTVQNLTPESRSERARQNAAVRRGLASQADEIIDQLRREATVDQAATATNSGANQEIGRVKHRLQQNEDVNLAKMERAEDLADTAVQQQIQKNNIPLNETPDRDAGINLVSSQSVDGLPVDQAEIVATGQGSVQGKQVLENAGLPSGSSSVSDLSNTNVAKKPALSEVDVDELELKYWNSPAGKEELLDTSADLAFMDSDIGRKAAAREKIYDAQGIKYDYRNDIEAWKDNWKAQHTVDPETLKVVPKSAAIAKTGQTINVANNSTLSQADIDAMNKVGITGVKSAGVRTSLQDDDLRRKEFTPQQVARVKNTVRVEKPSSQEFVNEQLEQRLNKLQQETTELKAKQETLSRASALMAQGLQPRTTRFDNALAAGMVGKSGLIPRVGRFNEKGDLIRSSAADRALGVTDPEFQENVVLSQSLEEALPPTQRLYYEQTSEGQIIPETVEKRQERPVRITQEDTKTLKSAGGRIGSTAQTRSVIGPYGIERENFPKADITKRPTDMDGKKSFSTQPPAAGDPKESMTMAEEVRKIYNNPNISPEKRADAAQDFLSSRMKEINISAIGDSSPLRKNPYGGRRRRLR
tara:strand:+ start:331 stop:2559 length:2229 start_codon:yes stop_codon:yes gene_type:complete